jgi:methyl-accepting chemotaxis protein
VAEEVRNLAQRTAAASKETSAKIDDVVSWISQCDILKTEVVATLSTIAAKARELAELVAAMTDTSRQQTEDMGQVNGAVAQVSETTRQNAATTEECAMAVAELQTRSGMMRESMSQLRAMLGEMETQAASRASAREDPALPVVSAPGRARVLPHV